MGKYFRTIYLYIVSFATLCMVIVGFVGTVDSLVSYAYPVINEYEVEDAYDYSKNKDDLSYLAKIVELEKVEKRTNLKETFTYLAVFVCGLPLYTFHLKQIKKESEKGV